MKEMTACRLCLYMMVVFILIRSLEELKDLSDKPEIMDIFLTKLESVSEYFIAFTADFSAVCRPRLFKTSFAY